MDPDAVYAVNFSVLRRHDPSIEQIVDSSSHGVIYTFDKEAGAWKKKGVEGAIFLFKRRKHPVYGLFMMNRLGMDNYVVFLTPGINLELTTEYIIYKTEDDAIHGIWLYETADRERIGKKLLELQMLGTNEPLPSSEPAPPVSSQSQQPPAPVGKSIDILTLFQQAASQQNSNPKPQTSTTQPNSMPPNKPAAKDSTETSGVELLNSLLAGTKINGSPFSKSQPASSTIAKTGSLLDQQKASIETPAPQVLYQPVPRPANDGSKSLLASLGVSGAQTSIQHSQPPSSSERTAPLGPSPSQFSHEPVLSSLQPPPSQVAPLAYPLNGPTPLRMSAPPSPLSHQMYMYPASPAPSLSAMSSVNPQQAFDSTLQEIARRFGVPLIGSEKGVLSKPEFIQAYLDLLRNDPSFLDALYDNYVNIHQRGARLRDV